MSSILSNSDNMPKDSHVLGPIVVRHQVRPCPFLAVRVGALASEETVLGLLENREP